MNIQARALFATLASAPLLGGTLAAQIVRAGEVVATYCPDLTGLDLVPDPNGACVILVDSRGVGPLGVNWFAPLYSNTAAPLSERWIHSNLGTVFGLALDNHSSIYVTATTVYGDYGAATFGSGGGGCVYRIDGVTGNIDEWLHLPNATVFGQTAPGLGDICYDPYFDQFFVSNFSDGRIYQVKQIGVTGVVTDVHDPFETYPCPCPNPGSPPPLFAPLGERVWAVHVTKVPRRNGNLVQQRVVLLFSVWLRDEGRRDTPWPSSWGLMPAGASVNNAVFAWELDAMGNPVASGPVVYRVMPTLEWNNQDLGFSNPVSDITSDARYVYFGEKTIPSDYGGLGYTSTHMYGHRARVLAYPKLKKAQTFPPPVIQPDPFRFLLGTYEDDVAVELGWSCAGGIAVEPFTQFTFISPPLWSTGDALNYPTEHIYGLQRIPGVGNQFDTPITANCNLIDLDGDVNAVGKSQPGDVEYVTRDALQ